MNYIFKKNIIYNKLSNPSLTLIEKITSFALFQFYLDVTNEVAGGL